MGATHTLDSGSVRSFFGKRLNSAVLEMCDGKPRAGRLKWYFDEIAKPVVRVKPLGNYPEAAAEKLEQGRSFAAVAAPLFLTLAWLRSLAGISPRPLNIAILNEQKEQGEAENAQVVLAECVNNPERSALEIYIKETQEHIEAETQAVESARAALLGMGK